MMAYKIKDWDETFENYRSRELKEPRYVSWPVRKDSESFQRLVRQPGGALAFGVFAYLVQLAARCPERGTLEDDKGDISPDRVAFRLGITNKEAEQCFQLLSGQGVEWLTSCNPVQSRAQSVESIDAPRKTPPVLSTPIHSIPIQSSPVLTSEPEKTPDSTPTPFDRFWKAYPRKVGKHEARKAWDKAGAAKDIDRVLRMIRLLKESPDWFEKEIQFIPHPSTWINQRRWEDDDPPRAEILGPRKSPQEIAELVEFLQKGAPNAPQA